MGQYLKSYRVILTTKSPVFVGSGEKVQKKQYVLDREKEKMYLPEMKTMYHALQKRGMGQAYERYLLNRDEKDFAAWMQNNKISSKEYLPWMRYQLDCSDVALTHQTNDLLLCVKDPYGMPYIPGSTLKGALRTILLADKLLTDPNQKRRAQKNIRKEIDASRSKRRYLVREANDMEQQAFHLLNYKTNQRNSVQDIMRGMIISDSKPLSLKDLTVCQQIDHHVGGTKKRLPIMRECIRPGRQIEFTMTIDESLNPSTGETILTAIHNYLEIYNRFLRKFKKQNDVENTIYVGGAVGFVSKTVLYDIFEEDEAIQSAGKIFEITLPRSIAKQHKHYLDYEMGASPHAMRETIYEGKECEFGKCEIHLEEL
ncbi:MAG TPA: type III-A CRISPR-associated RAMP protein Csm5 [Candidatus Anaerostipes excrementavium]|uniref:CRISPR system Cms protein Csm5 n=1 Tax=Candidatus Anaerostipes excrementavium TaxID=2838463 RepID=A0A9D1WVA2_9FIRM|nr:type III-A CRISPR-associated RAMP protein Csm5 [uncultured Anaerostipes sp.]HIX67552.1 type III-A CRISPR-associated RAMP protein Csm5 [Candidatus Anaerostipes excrementavium]